MTRCLQVISQYLAVVFSLLLFAGTTAAQNANGNIDDRAYVCMMQDAVQLKPGVPVHYNGKTYYGCCPMCSGKMLSAPDRYMKAIDPVTRKFVDKAEAFVFGLNGTAYYFESQENRERFARNPLQYLNAEKPLQGES